MKNKKPVSELPNPLLIVIVVVVIAAALLLAPAAEPAGIESLEKTCVSDAECKNYIFYNVCEAACANTSGSNNKIAAEIEKLPSTCDPMLMDRWWGEDCKCINNSCQGPNAPPAEVIIATDKAEYNLGENVKITIENNKVEPVYTYFAINIPIIEEFKNGTWNKTSQYCSNLCSCVKVDNKEQVICMALSPPSEFYPEFESPLVRNWNQTKCFYESKICGDAAYEVGTLKPVDAGKYKARFCYWDKKDMDFTSRPYDALEEKEKCAEKEFTIKGSTAKNCDEYEGLMTEEERANCTCPSGQQKFGCLMNAYCATNSEKSCGGQADCPSGEHCISRDGKNWFCTGQICGCYYNDPEKPTVAICVD